MHCLTLLYSYYKDYDVLQQIGGGQCIEDVYITYLTGALMCRGIYTNH